MKINFLGIFTDSLLGANSEILLANEEEGGQNPCQNLPGLNYTADYFKPSKSGENELTKPKM